MLLVCSLPILLHALCQLVDDGPQGHKTFVNVRPLLHASTLRPRLGNPLRPGQID